MDQPNQENTRLTDDQKKAVAEKLGEMAALKIRFEEIQFMSETCRNRMIEVKAKLELIQTEVEALKDGQMSFQDIVKGAVGGQTEGNA